MTGWHCCSLPGIEPFPLELSEILSEKHDGTNIVIRLSGQNTAIDLSAVNIYDLIRKLEARNYLLAFFFDGRVDSRLAPIVVSADIVFATNDSSVELAGSNEEINDIVAGLIADKATWCKSIDLLFRDEWKAEHLVETGLVTGVISTEEFSNYQNYLANAFTANELKAMSRLRQTWNMRFHADLEVDLAQERITFRNCFKEGAAESIASYLQNRFKPIK